MCLFLSWLMSAMLLRQALAEGMLDPVLLWKDSRYEIWVPKARMDRLGYEPNDEPVDGVEQERQVDESDPCLVSEEDEVRALDCPCLFSG